MITPFHPASGQTVNINVSSSSQAVQVTSGSGLSQVRIMNDGSATVWVKFGTTNGVTATTTADIPIGAGAAELMSHQGPVYVAAIAGGSTGKIYFTPGEGV